nr:hypothetical protein KRP22_10929 [Phytophthora ramorum]
MRLNRLLLLVVVVFVACCSTIAGAEDTVQINDAAIDSTHEAAIYGHRNLKGNTTPTNTDAVVEERAGGPSLSQLIGLLKSRKFQFITVLPLLQQLQTIQQKFGTKAAAIYKWWVRTKLRARPSKK